MFTRGLELIARGDAGVAGGKAAWLGELIRAGIRVPPGFVVLARAFDAFAARASAADDAGAAVRGALARRAVRARRAALLAAELPEDLAAEIRMRFAQLGAPYVAVRSSATAEDSAEASWAGQLDSFLNTTEAELLANVRRCWASLYNPRALAYGARHGAAPGAVSVAVVVQAMVAASVAGVAFSVHPVSENRNEMIVEAGYGLGEAVVSGRITPDAYVVEKEPLRIVRRTVVPQRRGLYRGKAGGTAWRAVPPGLAYRQKLCDADVLRLARLVLAVERLCGFACDVEWVHDGDDFFVVQSRPITSLRTG